MVKQGYKNLIKLNRDNEIFEALSVEELLLVAVVATSLDEVKFALETTDWDELVSEYKKIEKEQL